jgi:Protein of unknown function (DUF2889)
MTIPQAAPQRQIKQRRQIDVQIYSRGHGLWEVDATLIDVKTRDALLAGQVRAADTPIQDMLLRLVIDERLNIVEAASSTRGRANPGEGDDHGDAYARLVGLNLLQGFRGALRERVGGVLGCAHLTELAQVLPKAVVQAFAGDVSDTRGDHGSSGRPFQIDRCHALRSNGAAVRTHFPRWYASAAKAPPAATFPTDRGPNP